MYIFFRKWKISKENSERLFDQRVNPVVWYISFPKFFRMNLSKLSGPSAVPWNFAWKWFHEKRSNLPLHQQEQKSGSCFLIVSLSFWLSSKDSRFVKSSFDDFLELLVFVIIFSVEPLLVVVNKGGSCLFGLPMGASDMCRLLEESSRSVLPWPKKRKMSNRKCLGFSREINVN